jgi:hypothetical protein
MKAASEHEYLTCVYCSHVCSRTKTSRICSYEVFKFSCGVQAITLDVHRDIATIHVYGESDSAFSASYTVCGKEAVLQFRCAMAKML